jgi:hypothetical protein
MKSLDNFRINSGIVNKQDDLKLIFITISSQKQAIMPMSTTLKY